MRVDNMNTILCKLGAKQVFWKKNEWWQKFERKKMVKVLKWVTLWCPGVMFSGIVLHIDTPEWVGVDSGAGGWLAGWVVGYSAGAVISETKKLPIRTLKAKQISVWPYGWPTDGLADKQRKNSPPRHRCWKTSPIKKDIFIFTGPTCLYWLMILINYC